MRRLFAWGLSAVLASAPLTGTAADWFARRPSPQGSIQLVSAESYSSWDEEAAGSEAEPANVEGGCGCGYDAACAGGCGGDCSCHSACDACGGGNGCGGCGSCGDCGYRPCWDGCGSPCDRLLGIIARSDYCFNDFISPISNPLFFEDPRQLTEARFIYAHHRVPGSAPVVGNGDINYYALQVRAALNNRLSIVANKDGYIDINTQGIDQDGWADVAAGLKYTLVRNPQRQFLLSTGLIYEVDMGSHKVLQGRGDGEFHVFLTGGKQFGNWHWISGSGFRLPTNTTDRSQMWYWSNHWDYRLTQSLYGLFEVNWFHWMQSGNGDLGTNGFEGFDLFNLGSTGVAGNDIVTSAVGGKLKPYRNVEIGLAYEFPLTERRDVLDDRIYADFIVRY